MAPLLLFEYDELQVQAVNEVGVGEWSEPLEVISGPGVPEPPTQPKCLVKSPHVVVISWLAPCNNGAKITEYKLEWLKPDQQEYILVRICLVVYTLQYTVLYSTPSGVE